jgi:hypothetical protein
MLNPEQPGLLEWQAPDNLRALRGFKLERLSLVAAVIAAAPSRRRS